jgi:hypothetical protein
VEVEIEKPHVQHHPTGNKRLDMILPVTALFVSLVSILIAWHHSQIMRELVHQNERIVEAESLPYVEIDTSDLDTDLRNAAFRLTVQNQGVGPARIAEVTMKVNGNPVPDLATLIDHCCASGFLQASKRGNKQFRGVKNGDVVISTLRDRMIRPGEAVDVFNWTEADANRDVIEKLKQGFASNSVTTAICYCSVFDDCWARTDDDRRPTPVKECPVATVPYRQ